MEILNDFNKGIHIHLDYLSFTFPLTTEKNDIIRSFENVKYDIADLFFMSDSAYSDMLDTRQNGYEKLITLGEFITIRFGGENTKMKVDANDMEDNYSYSCQVELKGQGCREIEFLSNGNIDYSKIIDYFLIDLNGRCTRIDIALDDKNGDIITLDEIVSIVKKGYYTSRFKVNQNPPKLNTSLPGIDIIDKGKGISLYFGKSNSEHKSDRELCIYDKKAERNFRHVETNMNYYCRYEIRFRNELADDVAATLSDNLRDGNYDIGYFFKNELFRLLKLRIKRIDGKKTIDTKISRWDINPKWAKFLDNVDGLKLVQRPEVIESLEIKKNWNIKNITKQETLFDIADSFTNGISYDGWIDKVYKDTYDKILNKLSWFEEHTISQKELSMINNYRLRQYSGNVCELTMNDIYEYISILKERKELLEKNFSTNDLPF